MDLDRKFRHEQFTKLIGSPSILEFLSFTLSFFIFPIIHTNICISLKVKSWRFPTLLGLDIILFLLPQLLFLSLLSHYINLCAAVLFMVACLWSLHMFIHSNSKIVVVNIWKAFDISMPVTRSITVVLVCIMIFNIDLPICPRRFAKTEYFGLSIMDAGTGIFIAITAIHGSRVMYSLSEKVDILRQLKKSVMPCFLIGALRSIVVRILRYQNSVDEYGMHWNFFLTVATVRLISTLAFSLLAYQNIVRPVTFRVKLCYSLFCSFIFLSACHYLNREFGRNLHQSWPSFAERQQSVLVANIEGLVSLAGYISLYFIILSYMMTFQNITYRFMFKDSINKQKYFISLLLLSTLSTVVSCYYGLGSGSEHISRRFANLPYVSSITFFFCLFTFLEWVTHCVIECMHQGLTQGDVLRPVLYASVHRHSMAYFMLSNLFTGCINLFIDTTSFIPPNSRPDAVTGAFDSLPAGTVCAQFLLLSVYSILGIICINLN